MNKIGQILDYNPKIKFKFIENLWQERDHRESEQGIKQVYSNKILPHSFTEKMFYKCMMAYERLFNGGILTTKKVIDTYLIFKEKYNFTNENKIVIEEIVTLVNQELCSVEPIETNFIAIFKKVITSRVFMDFDIEMAKLLANYILVMNNKPPIIMYCYSTNKMANLVRYNVDDSEILKVLNLLITRTNRFNVKHKYLSLDEIKSCLYQNIDYFKEKLGLQHMYIFGSYSRNEQTEYSDLDLLCYVADQYAYMANLKRDIAMFARQITGIDVDVLINNISFDPKQVPVDIFIDKIKIF